MQLTNQLTSVTDQLPAAQTVLLVRRQAAAAAAAAAGADQQRHGVYGMLKHAFRQVLARVGCSSSGQTSPGGGQTSTAPGQTSTAGSPTGSSSSSDGRKGAWVEPWFEGLSGWQLEQQVCYVLALAEQWEGVQRLLEAAEEARARLILAARTGGLGSSKVDWWEAAAASAGAAGAGGRESSTTAAGAGSSRSHPCSYDRAGHWERQGFWRRSLTKGMSLGWWVVMKLGVGDAATLAALEPLTAADVLLVANGGKEVIWELLSNSAKQVWQQRYGQRWA